MIDSLTARRVAQGGDSTARVYRDQWIRHCVEMAKLPADFYSGCRKINSCMVLEYPMVDDSLTIADSGFTKMKLGMLRRLYWDAEHAEKVAELWRGRVDRGKYGSVSVSTYHHITKSDPAKRSKRASVMGPCLLGVSFTLLNDRTVGVDAFYRTTELFKKFPADLVFIRDTVVPAIMGDGVEWHAVKYLRCHFANVTSHPMYAVTWLPHLGDAAAMIRELDAIKDADRRFYDWLLKWTGRYICPEYHRGIAKFAQALRVQKDALNRITGKNLATLREYVRDNHPGYRGEYEDGDDESEE